MFFIILSSLRDAIGPFYSEAAAQTYERRNRHLNIWAVVSDRVAQQRYILARIVRP